VAHSPCKRRDPTHSAYAGISNAARAVGAAAIEPRTPSGSISVNNYRERARLCKQPFATVALKI
jgi:hypothetical protein